MQAFSRKYRLLCRQFADIYPAHRFCKLLQLRYRQFNRAVAAPARRKNRLIFFQSLVQIHPHAFLDSKRADASDRMSDPFLHLIRRKHLRLRTEKCLVFCIVNPGISRTHDQHRLSIHQKRQSLCNPPCFRVQRFRRQFHRCRGDGGTGGSDLPSYILLNMPLPSPATSHKPLFLRQEVSFLLLLSCTLPHYSIAIHHTPFSTNCTEFSSF